MKKLLNVVLVLLFTVALTGCSMFGGGNSVDGKYELVSVEVYGNEYTKDDSEWDYLGADGSYIELKSGDAYVDLFGMTGEGSYKVSGSTVTITIDGDPQDFTVKGNTLTVDLKGMTLTLEK